MTGATARLYQLTAWLRGLGCCGACALWWALAAVAREEGEPPPTGRVRCAAPPHRRDLCDGYARARWADRQKRQITEPRKAA